MATHIVLSSEKNKWVAFFICVPFGLFGLHYFYVGKPFRGMLAFITLNFCAIGWFRDMVKILSGNFEDKHGAYLR